MDSRKGILLASETHVMVGEANKKLHMKVLQIEMNAIKGRRGTLKYLELIYGLSVEIFKLKPKDEKEIVVMQGVGVIRQRTTCLRSHDQDWGEWGPEATHPSCPS